MKSSENKALALQGIALYMGVAMGLSQHCSEWRVFSPGELLTGPLYRRNATIASCASEVQTIQCLELEWQSNQCLQ